MKFRGMKIKIENPAGSVRSGIDRVTGLPWKVRMVHPYGEIVGTKGVDGDPVDCFVGPDQSAPFVYVIHQLQKHDGAWDEDKCMLGFSDAMDAKAAYYKNFDNPDLFFGDIEAIPLKVFKQKVFSNNGETMIHAGAVHKGDQVTVDGMRGRGVIVEEEGSDVVIRFRSGIHIKRNRMNVHPMTDNTYHSQYWSGDRGNMKASYKTIDLEKMQKMMQGAKEEMVERENGPITPPQGINKRIEKMGTLFCVLSDGTDKNFGCYGSREQAEAVLKGQSFIQPDLPKNLQAVSGNMPQTGWQYGKRSMPVGYLPQRTLTGFPSGTGGGRGGLPKVPHAKPTLPARPMHHPKAHIAKPATFKPVHSTMPKTLPKPGPIIKPKPMKVAQPAKVPKPPAIKAPKSQVIKAPHAHKTLESFGDLGEPMAGALGHMHIEPNAWFHAPSLLKRGKADYIPTDDPKEKDDKFLDVTKRDSSDTKLERMKRLKRSAPGGLPAMIPAHTTLLEPHQATFAPTIAGARLKFKKDKTLIDIIHRNETLSVPHQIAYTTAPKVKASFDLDDKRMRRGFHAAFI